MSILDNFTKKVGEAAQAAAKKSNELLEVTKVNMSINTEEEKMKELFEQLGVKVFQKFSQSGEIPEEFKALCEEIKIHDDAVKELKHKVMELKNVKVCPACGVEVEDGTAFCSKCGAKIE